MKMSQCTIVLSIGTAMLLPLFSAHATMGHFYVKGDFGGAVTEDTELKEFFGEPLANNTKVKFDPGFRLGLHGGYGILDWLDAEVETGFVANHIDTITGTPTSHDHAYLENIPLMFNLKLHGPDEWKVSPYIGGGVGISTSILWADDWSVGATTLDGVSSDTVFAWQAFAGLRFAINDHMGVSVEYHYFAVDPTSMEADSTSGTTSDRLRLGGVQSHTFSLAFDYKF